MCVRLFIYLGKNDELRGFSLDVVILYYLYHSVTKSLSSKHFFLKVGNRLSVSELANERKDEITWTIVYLESCL